MTSIGINADKESEFVHHLVVSQFDKVVQLGFLVHSGPPEVPKPTKNWDSVQSTSDEDLHFLSVPSFASVFVKNPRCEHDDRSWQLLLVRTFWVEGDGSR